MPNGRVGGTAPGCGAQSRAGVKAEKCRSVGVIHGVTGDFYRAFSFHELSRMFNEPLPHTAVMFLYTGKALEFQE